MSERVKSGTKNPAQRITPSKKTTKKTNLPLVELSVFVVYPSLQPPVCWLHTEPFEHSSHSTISKREQD